MRRETERETEGLRGRLAELVGDLERCPAAKCGTRWWLDRLEGAALVRRQLDRIERDVNRQ